MKLSRFIGMLVIALMTFSTNAFGEGLISISDHNDKVITNDFASFDACDIAPSSFEYAFILLPIVNSFNDMGNATSIIINPDPDNRTVDIYDNNAIATSRYSLQKTRFSENYILKYRAANPNFKKYLTYQHYRDTYLIEHSRLC